MIKALYDQSILWQMSAAERMAIFYIIDRLPRKQLALEIGSYKGGCLRTLAQHFEEVISLDLDHSNIVSPEQYKNVTWLPGDSAYELPRLLGCRPDIDLVIVDGDHSYAGVLSDLTLLMESPLKDDAIILVHDAAYRDTAKAIEAVFLKYPGCVKQLFVPGEPFNEGMIGGLALICKRDLL